MNIIVNGDKISIEKNINLENFLKLNNINNKNIVIEINKIIITKRLTTISNNRFKKLYIIYIF